jgi:hypothetical protein
MARRDTAVERVLAVQGEEQVIWVCVKGRTKGVPDTFGAPRDTDSELQWREAGAQLAAFMDCTQRSQAQPGFAYGNGPDTPRGFGEGEAITVE